MSDLFPNAEHSALQLSFSPSSSISPDLAKRLEKFQQAAQELLVFMLRSRKRKLWA